MTPSRAVRYVWVGVGSARRATGSCGATRIAATEELSRGDAGGGVGFIENE